MTFDLQQSFTVTKITIYFHQSNDTERKANPFVISISVNDVTYADSFDGVNTPGTPLLTGEEFAFPDDPVARYVRLTAILDEDQWLSINEVEMYVDLATPAPYTGKNTPAPSVALVSTVLTPTPLSNTASASTSVPTASPSGIGPWQTMMPAISMAPTSGPTPLGTPMGGLGCSNVTVSNTNGMDGLYVLGPNNTFLSTATSSATIASSQLATDCADGVSTNCAITKWTISSDVDTGMTYMAYDNAEHPSDVTEVWLRVNCSSNTKCVNSPAGVEVVCGDGSSISTPAPVALSSTDCGIVEVAGILGEGLDGTYYDDGSSPSGGVTRYMGYDAGDLTSNGNTLAANWTNGGCPSPSETGTSTDGDCSWREWRIMPGDDNLDAHEYFTFDEADHPVDIARGIQWYMLDVVEKPYDGAINITCAPADTPALPTSAPTTIAPTAASPAPTATMPVALVTDDSSTRQPVNGSVPPTEGALAVEAGGSESTGADNTPAIIGGAAGAAALLALVGIVTYRRMSPPPPPSYDDIVGRP
ncbi:unnamed protein product [Ascophyllum nodosum]